MTISKWKNLARKAIWCKANNNYLKERQGKYKHRLVTPYKTQIKMESYLTNLKRNQAIAIFKLRYGMTYLRANFTSNPTEKICIRCDLNQIEDENHLLVCPSRSPERNIFHVGNLNPAFKLDTDLFRLSVIAEYLICTGLVSKYGS